MGKRVVVSGSSISTGQLVNFFLGIESGTYSFESFQQYLQDPNRFVPEVTQLDRAIKVLGTDKVVTAIQAHKAWGRESPGEEVSVVGLREGILQSAADTNKTGATDFRLVYCLGISLRDQREFLGVDLKKLPCYSEEDWWLAETEDSWATRNPACGYRLLDFRLRFGGLGWNVAEDEIARLGADYSRADEVIVAEACSSVSQVHDKRLLAFEVHAGATADSKGDIVSVGLFQERVLHVFGHPKERSRSRWGVVGTRD